MVFSYAEYEFVVTIEKLKMADLIWLSNIKKINVIADSYKAKH